MKKIGILCLAVVMCLAMLGVGYAHWSQTLYIDTTVKTGSVDVGFINAYSYDPCVTKCDPGPLFPGSGYEYLYDTYACPSPTPRLDKNVAGCWVELLKQKGTKQTGVDENQNPIIVPVYELVEITLCNGYPSYWNLVDLVVTNFGTVPVKLELMQVRLPDGSWVDVSPGVAYDYDWNLDKLPDFNVRVDSIAVGQQIDPCSTDTVWFDIHVKQDAPQGAIMSFLAQLKFTQWNLVK